MDLKTKLQSRSFWLCVALFLSGIATAISGLGVESSVITGIGMACSVLSVGIFTATNTSKDNAYAQAQADIAAASSAANTTAKTVTATTANEKVVSKVLEQS